MSPELKQIWRYSLKATALICLTEMAAAALFCRTWPERFSWLAGIAFGGLVGMAGLYMICMMAAALKADSKSMKAKGAAGYVFRYAFYAVCLFAGTYAGLSVLGMLGGLLANKASLLLFSLTGRKERQ